MAITCLMVVVGGGGGGERPGKHKILHGTKVIPKNAKDRDSLTQQGAAAFLGQTLGWECYQRFAKEHRSFYCANFMLV